MKKQTLFIAIVLFAGVSVILGSCKKKDDGTPAATGIVSRWEQQTAHTVDVDSTTTPPTVDVTDTTFTHGKSFIIEFKSDSTFSVRDYSATPDTVVSSGTYSLPANNKVVTIDTKNGNQVDQVTYSISGNTLTMDESAGLPGFFSFSVHSVYQRQ